jgi:hypothetical protein
MSIVDSKRQIYGQIAAFRTSCEGFPKFDLTNSFSSVCNGTNSLDFLLDLLKATIGFEQLINVSSDIFTFELPKIEEEIKKVLKRELKKMVSCGIDPSIPDFFKHQNIVSTATGIDLDLPKIDYMGVMLIDPDSQAGILTFEDPSGGLSSTDFNTYLFETVQLDGTQTDWGSQVLGAPNDVLSIEFNSSGPPNNQLNVRASEYYSNSANGKTLTDLNNDFIDSISLFGTGVMLNSIVDSLFGSLSFEVGKTQEQIKKEVEVEDIIQCILNVDEDIIIDDGFFDFDNEAIRRQEEEIDNRKNGIRVLKNCGNVTSSVSLQTLSAVTANINTATTMADKSQAVNEALQEISEEVATEVSVKNKITAELNFVSDAIKKLMVRMGNIILSPKVIVIFAINHFIIHGVPLTDPIEWMKKNRVLFQAVLNAIRDAVIKKLMEIAIKEIKQLAKCVAIVIATEYAKNQTAQLSSLVGISPDVIRIILGLGSQALQNPLLGSLVSGQKVTGFGCNKGDCNG